ncbi:MAG: porin [Pirellulaceae bacterium]
MNVPLMLFAPIFAPALHDETKAIQGFCFLVVNIGSHMKRSTKLTAILVALGFVTQSAFGQESAIPLENGTNTIGSVVGQDLAGVDEELKKLQEDVAELLKRTDANHAGLEKLTESLDKDDDDSDSADFEKDLKKNSESLEKVDGRVKKIEDKIGNLVRAGHSDATMKLSGRIHLDYWSFPQTDPTLFPLEGGDPQDTWFFRRMRFGVAGDITEQLGYKIEMEFAGGADSQFRDAFVSIDDLPYFNTVLIGNHKRPYGLDHLNSSRYNVFMERPAIVESFNQDARRLGISSNGNTKDLKYNWRYGYWNQQIIQGTGGYRDDHYQGEFAGRFAATPWYDEVSGGRGYIHFAVSGSLGDPDGLSGNNQARYQSRPENRTSRRWIDTQRIDGATHQYLGGLETVVNVGSLQVVGEYQMTTVDRRPGFGDDVNFNGGYVYVSYFLTGEHMPWDRETGTLGRIHPIQNFFSVRNCDGCIDRGWGAWQLCARYSAADLTDSDINGGISRIWTMGANWYWNPYCRWQFNYQLGDVERAPTGFGDFKAIGMRFMVDF